MEEKKRPEFLGFLTVFRSAGDGLIGGFLVLYTVGRPVEFHCTAPVKPNRAQEILYGNTLNGFICGEQIAPALVGRSKTELVAIFTNDPNFLTAPELLKAPLGIVFSHIETEPGDKERYALWEQKQDQVKNDGSIVENNEEETVFDEGNPKSDSLLKTVLGNSLNALPFVPGVDYSLWREIIRGKNHLALPLSYTFKSGINASFDEIVKRIDPFLKYIDSVEPFERIRLAVEEAQKSC